MKFNLRRTKAILCGKLTGFEPKIIIEVGINAHSYKEAKKEAEEVAKVMEIKLKDYLDQFPYKIEVK